MNRLPAGGLRSVGLTSPVKKFTGRFVVGTKRTSKFGPPNVGAAISGVGKWMVSTMALAIGSILIRADPLYNPLHISPLESIASPVGATVSGTSKDITFRSLAGRPTKSYVYWDRQTLFPSTHLLKRPVIGSQLNALRSFAHPSIWYTTFRLMSSAVPRVDTKLSATVFRQPVLVE